MLLRKRMRGGLIALGLTRFCHIWSAAQCEKIERCRRIRYEPASLFEAGASQSRTVAKRGSVLRVPQRPSFVQQFT
jgi:hypothetical protein